MLRTGIVTVVFALIAGSASAEAITYACKLKGKSLNYIAEEMVIGLDGDAGTAIIADPIVMFYEEKPIQTKITQNTAKKQSFRWEIAMRSRTGQTFKMKYRGALQFPSMRLTVYAKPSGYSNDLRMQGTCVVSDQKLDLG